MNKHSRCIILGTLSTSKIVIRMRSGAYRKSLRLNPKDDDARYNLLMAQAKLKDQQNNKNKDDKKDKNKNQDQKQNQQNQQNQGSAKTAAKPAKSGKTGSNPAADSEKKSNAQRRSG